MKCRHCEKPLHNKFLDLGFSPIANAFLDAEKLLIPELYYPLKVSVCECCWLVQTHDFARQTLLFNDDYVYFSSISSSWLTHAEKYVFNIISEFELGSSSFVIEIGSNDGYLLKNFVMRGIPCLGFEPTKSTATAAEELGIPVVSEFFTEVQGLKMASKKLQGDLIICNNVYAHVPDINDFTKGLKAALKPDGIISMEFPHVMRLLNETQFDTVYHEHFSYLSLATVIRIFAFVGLKVWRVEEIPTHGGSLRVYGCHEHSKRQIHFSVDSLLKKEKDNGVEDLTTYSGFQPRADKIKDDLLAFLIDQKTKGRRVAAYGAAAKGNTMLNYAGIKPDLINFVADMAKAKQQKFLPGSHIPVLDPSEVDWGSLDYVLILPWNIADEVKQAVGKFLKPGAAFVTAIPSLKIHQ